MKRRILPVLPERISLLATDLDGTLLTSEKTITPYSQRVLIEAQKRGLTVVLASGRPICSILPFAEQLELHKHGGFIISFNGSLVWDCVESRAVNGRTLPLPLIARLAEAVSDEFHIHGYRGNSIVCRGCPDEWSKYISRANRMSLLETENFTEAITEPQYKCLITGDPRKLWHLEKRLKSQFGSCLSICRSESFLLEVMPEGIDKADALGVILERVGCGTEELMCCGDGYNDMNMLRLSGLPCATQNARKQVKEAAAFVTKSNDCDGVAHAVVKFCLKTGRTHRD